MNPSVTPEKFKALCLQALKQFGKESPGSGNWRLFRKPLIISYYPNRNTIMVSWNETHPATVIWCGVENRPVASLDESTTILEKWLADTDT
jgi:hypothetical protein